MSEEELVERIARAICAHAFDGFDPDELVTHKPPPGEWMEEGRLPSDPDAEEHYYYDEVKQDSFHAWKRWRHYTEQARACLSSIDSAGYRVVPVEPTEGPTQEQMDRVLREAIKNAYDTPPKRG